MRYIPAACLSILMVAGCSRPTFYCDPSNKDGEGICTKDKTLCEEGLTDALQQTCEKVPKAYCFELHEQQVFLCARTMALCEGLHVGLNADQPECQEMVPELVMGP